MARIIGPNGQVADVDNDNKLQVFSIRQHEDKFKNIDGRFFSIFFSITPAAPGNNFFFMTNTGIFDLFIADINISSSVPSQFLYKKVLGTPVGGSAAAVTNRKMGNPKLPNATIQEGTNITGLTDDGIFLFEEIEIANSRRSLQI